MKNLQFPADTTMPDPKTLVVEDVSIRYYDEGKGETIVLIHGWPQTAYTWRYMIPELSKNYRVIAFDLPGTGESGTTKAYDAKSISAIISHFTQDLEAGQFHLVGHDVGAWISATFALYFGFQLKSLTVIDAGIPGLIPDLVFSPQNAAKIWQFYFHAIAEMPELLTKEKEKEYLNWYFVTKAYVKDAITENDLDIYVNAFQRKQGFDYYRSFTQSAADNLAADRKIQVPVLAVGAQYGIGDAIGIAMNKVSDHVTAYNIEDCGHYVPEERPEQLLALIYAHIENCKNAIEYNI
jgi:pimeloyl-ACP methyl ester carboxylesterase